MDGVLLSAGRRPSDYQRSVRYWVFLLLPSVLFVTLSFVGLFLMAVALFGVRLVRRARTGESVLWAVREALSLENLVVALIPGIALLLYFMGNVAGSKASSAAFGLSVGGKADLVTLVAVAALQPACEIQLALSPT